jgi:hypothetical protein
MVLSEPFYFNDVLVTLDLIQSLLSVHWFRTDNTCSMEVCPFGLFVKDHATKHVLVRYDCTGSFYTLPFSASPTSTPRVMPNTLIITASSSTSHSLHGHPGPIVISNLPNTSAINCPTTTNDILYHAYQLGQHVRLPFPSSSIMISRPPLCLVSLATSIT